MQAMEVPVPMQAMEPQVLVPVLVQAAEAWICPQCHLWMAPGVVQCHNPECPSNCAEQQGPQATPADRTGYFCLEEAKEFLRDRWRRCQQHVAA